jgi:hypothetical protein
MNKGTRLVAGAAAACALVTAPAAFADTGPTQTGPLNGIDGGEPLTSVSLPNDVAQCLIDNGFPIPSSSSGSGSQLTLPTTSGALPANLTGTLPLAGAQPGTNTGSTSSSTTTTVPLSGTGTLPLPTTDGATGTVPLPGVGGSNPQPDGGAQSSYPGVQCGQIILNNNFYTVLVTVTTTTTTTTADGPIAAGPVSTTSPAAPAPVAAPKPAAPAKQKQRRSQRQQSHRRKSSKRREGQRNGARGKRAAHIVLVRIKRVAR